MSRLKSSKSLLLSLFMILMLAGCPGPDAPGNPSNPSNPSDSSNKLQDLVDDTGSGKVIDLTNKNGLTDYTANITEPVTIKNSPEGTTLSLVIECSGVELNNITADNVKATDGVGEGNLTIKDTKINDLLIQGGGSHSIYLEGVAINKLTLDKEGVRVVVSGGSTFAQIVVKKQAMLEFDGQSSTASISDSVIDNFKVGTLQTDAPVALAGCALVEEPNDMASISLIDTNFSGYQLGSCTMHIVGRPGFELKDDTLPNMLLEYAARTLPDGLLGWDNNNLNDETIDFYSGEVDGHSIEYIAMRLELTKSGSDPIYITSLADSSGLYYNRLVIPELNDGEVFTVEIQDSYGNPNPDFCAISSDILVLPKNFTVTIESEDSTTADIKSNLLELACDYVHTFIIDKDNPYIKTGSAGEVLSKDGAILYRYPVGKPFASYTVPNSVRTIASYAFAGYGYNEVETTIIIPSSVEVVEEYAFTNISTYSSFTVKLDGRDSIPPTWGGNSPDGANVGWEVWGDDDDNINRKVVNKAGGLLIGYNAP